MLKWTLEIDASVDNVYQAATLTGKAIQVAGGIVSVETRELYPEHVEIVTLYVIGHLHEIMSWLVDFECDHEESAIEQFTRAVADERLYVQ
jgi:hypothetical protein